MSSNEIARFKKGDSNLVPVVRTVLADLDTPLSVFLKLCATDPYCYLFESAAQGSEQWSRYSFIGLPCRRVLRVRGSTLTVEVDGEAVETMESDKPLDQIERFRTQRRVTEIEGLPRFYGGFVGYFGYDTVRYVEPRLRDSQPPDPLDVPDILLMESNEVVVFDNYSNQMQIITLVDASNEDAEQLAQERLDQIVERLQDTAPSVSTRLPSSAVDEASFTSSFGHSEFLNSVEKIREYIRAGDVMQVVLAQRMSAPFELPPVQLYRMLRTLNPSPYMYFMNMRDFHVVGSSPEILARVDGSRVVNRPLAGTRRRGRNAQEDEALEKELLADPKELAEHLMLIDLGRNDLGRVSRIGTVEVTEQFAIERYSHVMHISSNVEGELAPGRTAIDVLKATLPVGTLSGAPKIRAMEIIDELEPVKRGIYGGAVGYLAWNGNMDMAIAIRTAVIKDRVLYIEAGGGVVADSVPQLEWEESLNKCRAIFRAVQMADDFQRTGTSS